MANFFDIADNWIEALKREAAANNARQAEMQANLQAELRPLIDEAQRLAEEEFPAGALWEGIGPLGSTRDAYVTHVGAASARLYSDDYDDARTDDLQTVPTFVVPVYFQSAPSPKDRIVIDDFAMVQYRIGKDGNLVRYSGPGIPINIREELFVPDIEFVMAFRTN